MMKRKLYNIQQDNAPVASLLSSTQVLTHFPHKTLKAWMKYAQVGQWHGVAHPLLNNVSVKRIQ
jgi:hypothetical protein